MFDITCPKCEKINVNVKEIPYHTIDKEDEYQGVYWEFQCQNCWHLWWEGEDEE